MGFQLRPEFLREPPEGWRAARAYPMHKNVWEGPGDDDGRDPVFPTSMQLDVAWRVEMDGREPYEFEESRRAPVWTGGPAVSSAKRFSKPRREGSVGLLTELGVPCLVHPQHPMRIWIDWDAAFAEHEAVWGPFTRKHQRTTEERARQQHPDLEITPEVRRRIDEINRLNDVGREVTAKIVSDTDAGWTLTDLPMHVLTFEFELDGQTRFADFEYARTVVTARRYKVGKVRPIRVDPEDPTNVAPST